MGKNTLSNYNKGKKKNKKKIKSKKINRRLSNHKKRRSHNVHRKYSRNSVKVGGMEPQPQPTQEAELTQGPTPEQGSKKGSKKLVHEEGEHNSKELNLIIHTLITQFKKTHTDAENQEAALVKLDSNTETWIDMIKLHKDSSSSGVPDYIEGRVVSGDGWMSTFNKFCQTIGNIGINMFNVVSNSDKIFILFSKTFNHGNELDVELIGKYYENKGLASDDLLNKNIFLIEYNDIQGYFKDLFGPGSGLIMGIQSKIELDPEDSDVWNYNISPEINGGNLAWKTITDQMVNKDEASDNRIFKGDDPFRKGGSKVTDITEFTEFTEVKKDPSEADVAPKPYCYRLTIIYTKEQGYPSGDEGLLLPHEFQTLSYENKFNEFEGIKGLRNFITTNEVQIVSTDMEDGDVTGYLDDLINIYSADEMNPTEDKYIDEVPEFIKQYVENAGEKSFLGGETLRVNWIYELISIWRILNRERFKNNIEKKINGITCGSKSTECISPLATSGNRINDKYLKGLANMYLMLLCFYYGEIWKDKSGDDDGGEDEGEGGRAKDCLLEYLKGLKYYNTEGGKDNGSGQYLINLIILLMPKKTYLSYGNYLTLMDALPISNPS